MKSTTRLMDSLMTQLLPITRMDGSSGSVSWKDTNSLLKSTMISSKIHSICKDCRKSSRKTRWRRVSEWFSLLNNQTKRTYKTKVSLRSTKSHQISTVWFMQDSYYLPVALPRCTKSIWMESMEHAQELSVTGRKCYLLVSVMPWRLLDLKTFAHAVRKCICQRQEASMLTVLASVQASLRLS